jgi:hypothetical protein
MQSLVSRQSFPHLWKKLWKKALYCNGVPIQGLIDADFARGETSQGRPNGLFQGRLTPAYGKSGFGARRKPAEDDFSLNK